MYPNKLHETYWHQYGHTNEFDPLHDVIVCVTGKAPSDEQLYQYFRRLPLHIIKMAIEYGMNDTEVREQCYSYIETITEKAL